MAMAVMDIAYTARSDAVTTTLAGRCGLKVYNNLDLFMQLRPGAHYYPILLATLALMVHKSV